MRFSSCRKIENMSRSLQKLSKHKTRIFKLFWIFSNEDNYCQVMYHYYFWRFRPSWIDLKFKKSVNKWFEPILSIFVKIVNIMFTTTTQFVLRNPENNWMSISCQILSHNNALLDIISSLMKIQLLFKLFTELLVKYQVYCFPNVVYFIVFSFI